MKGFMKYLNFVENLRDEEKTYYNAGFEFIDDEAWKKLYKYENTLMATDLLKIDENYEKKLKIFGHNIMN